MTLAAASITSARETGRVGVALSEGPGAGMGRAVMGIPSIGNCKQQLCQTRCGGQAADFTAGGGGRSASLVHSKVSMPALGARGWSAEPCVLQCSMRRIQRAEIQNGSPLNAFAAHT